MSSDCAMSSRRKKSFGLPIHADLSCPTTSDMMQRAGTGSDSPKSRQISDESCLLLDMLPKYTTTTHCLPFSSLFTKTITYYSIAAGQFL
jgi:hypothetical protein